MLKVQSLSVNYAPRRILHEVSLEVQSGEVLALANWPAYNPNNRAKPAVSVLRNRSLTDLFEPGSTMTNANVEAMVTAAGKRELTLKYKDGMQKILVPEGVPIVRAVPGNRSDLKVGEYVFAVAQVAPSGPWCGGAYGPATALSLMMAVGLALLSWIYFRLTRGWSD